MNYQQFRPQGFSFLPPVVKNLLIINGILYLASLALQSRGIDLSDMLGLHYFGAQKFSPFQFVTYMFMHGSPGHIIFNMFALWMFGYTLENIWGSKRFLLYYMITGIGAAIVHYLIMIPEIMPVVKAINVYIANPSYESLQAFVSDHTFKVNRYSGDIYIQFEQFKTDFAALSVNPQNKKALIGAANFLTVYREYYLNLPNVIGASGAVFGILLAFGMMFPNVRLYIYMLIPIKAKWFVIIYGLVELYLGFSQSHSNVAHFAHLGGMLFGFFLIKYWKRKGVF